MDEKLRILLCEDDENLGMLLREYLQAKGYAAELYPDGEAGYKAFLKNKYDLCVFDVMMPKKDGFTLAQEVRAANAEIPIIFLTAKTLKEDILEGFKIGADDYITKPFSMEDTPVHWPDKADEDSDSLLPISVRPCDRIYPDHTVR